MSEMTAELSSQFPKETEVQCSIHNQSRARSGVLYLVIYGLQHPKFTTVREAPNAVGTHFLLQRGCYYATGSAGDAAILCRLGGAAMCVLLACVQTGGAVDLQ